MIARCPSCAAVLPEDADACTGCRRLLAGEVVVLERGDAALPGGPAPVLRARAARREPRRWTAAGALVLALVATGLPWNRLVPPRSLPVAGEGAPPSAASPVRPSGPAAGPRVPPVAALPDGRYPYRGDDGGARREALADLAGPPLPPLEEPTGLHLLAVGPGGSRVVDVDRRASASAEFPADAGRPVVRGDRLVAVTAGEAVVLSWAGARLVTERRLGRADDAFASEHEGRVWLRAGAEVREVDMAGMVTAAPVSIPAMGAGGGGLLVGSSGGIEVRSPSGGRLLRRIDEAPPVVAFAGRWAASADREGLSCWIVLTDLRSGQQRSVPLLPYRTCLQGRAAMSPDGRHLAVPASEYVRGLGQTNGALVVVDVEAGTAVAVERARRRVPLFDSLTWAPSGAWLFWLDPIGAQVAGGFRVGSSGAVAVSAPGVDEDVERIVAFAPAAGR